MGSPFLGGKLKKKKESSKKEEIND